VLRDATAWIKALRLQFYPMSWAAYTIGALLARGAACFDQQSYWWGYLALFLLEAATVFVNDLVDFEGDCVNGCAGPFNGGSRVLVTGAVERRPLLRAVGLTLAGALGSAIIAGLTSPHPVAAFAMLAAMAVLALGYTAPPLKLCYRALGELDVAFTHSLGMILCGVALLGGNPFGAAPWLLGLPLFLSIVPAITLSGFPDRRADASVGKHTLAVHLGATGAAAVAILAVIGAAAMAWAWPYLTPDVAGYRYLVYLAAPHAVALTVLCVRFLQRGAPVKRIDGLMVVALTFILWFCVVPLVALLGPSGGA
jgi:1,4-dihydroxy-2-naphthoate octaprenyltransferase